MEFLINYELICIPKIKIKLQINRLICWCVLRKSIGVFGRLSCSGERWKIVDGYFVTEY